MRRANVYYRDTLAGILSQDSGGYVFEYLPGYLGNPALPAISLTFPKQRGRFSIARAVPILLRLAGGGRE